jgi:hypothetical protein
MAAAALVAEDKELDSGKLVASPGPLGRIRDLLSCRRRAPSDADRGASSSKPGYEALRKRSEHFSEEQKAAFKQMAWWSKTETKMGAKIFVLAPRGPGGDTECYIDMWSLLAYVISQMHDHVVERGELYAVVWCQFSDHRVWPFSARRFQKLLPLKYSHGLDAVHVVHPSWTSSSLMSE